MPVMLSCPDRPLFLKTIVKLTFVKHVKNTNATMARNAPPVDLEWRQYGRDLTLHQVAIYAVAVSRPANADAALQAKCDVPAIAVKMNCCSDYL